MRENPIIATEPPSQATPFEEQAQLLRQRFEAALSAHFIELQSAVPPHSRLLESVQYSVLLGGKRLRPLLVLEACRLLDGTEDAAMPAAIAVELIHAFSLIHDDLPAMDNDDLRRGQPTNHKVFGDAIATLAGDWLVPHAFRLLTRTPASAETVVQLVRALADGTLGMVEGQAADISSESAPTDATVVQYIHLQKTARLIEASCKLGAICAEAPPNDVARVASYGRRLGLAFQIVDDLLDRTGATHVLGKRAGKDHQVSKQTFPAAFGIDESRRRAAREIDAAISALEQYGDAANLLRGLAHFVLSRDH